MNLSEMFRDKRKQTECMVANARLGSTNARLCSATCDKRKTLNQPAMYLAEKATSSQGTVHAATRANAASPPAFASQHSFIRFMMPALKNLKLSPSG